MFLLGAAELAKCIMGTTKDNEIGSLFYDKTKKLIILKVSLIIMTKISIALQISISQKFNARVDGGAAKPQNGVIAIGPNVNCLSQAGQ